MRQSAKRRLAAAHAFWACAALLFSLVTLCATPPAKIVTEYALTSTHDLSYYDLRDWRLLGSTNDGRTWTTLDIQTNQFFGKRNERRSFKIANQTAFNIYRLQVDHINAEPDDPTPEQWQAQLAEMELIGHVTGVTNESDLGTVVTSSWSHPLIGPPENAFDNDLATRWVDFGPTLPSGCWIQCEYVPRSDLALVVTNISQLGVRARLAPTHDLLVEKGSKILADVEAPNSNPRILTAYALTSANDVPQRDPSDWRLLGSDDNGQHWTVIDTRSGERFATRFEKRVFTLAKPASFSTYRLEIDKIGSNDGLALQVGEIEPIYAERNDGREYSLAISAKTENPPTESADMAFDGDPKTKWLSFALPAPSDPCWIQWQSIPAEEGLPVINVRRLKPLIGATEKSRQLLSDLIARDNLRVRPLRGYTLTSATDLPSRDPANWRLLGSTNEGKSWNVLDTRTNEVFNARNESREYLLAKTVAYPIYRLQIDSVFSPRDANAVQIAMIEPLFATTNSNRFSVLVSAAGDSGLREAGIKAFDNDPRTKWLDRAVTSPTRASWIQWRYSAALDPANPGQRAFDLDRIETEATGRQLLSIRPIKAHLEGVVVSEDANARRIGLLDQTGFQIFQLDSSVGAVKPGDRVRLEGQIHFGSAFPEVLNTDLKNLGSLPSAGKIAADQRFERDQQFLWGTVSGTVAAVSQGAHTATIRLQGEDGASGLRLKILNPGSAHFVDLTGRRIEARGVVAPALDDRDHRVPGTVWVADPIETSLDAVTENEWQRIRLISIAQACATNIRIFGPIRVRGTAAHSIAGFLLTDGTNHLLVPGKAASALGDGSLAEASGVLGHDGRFSALQFARIRAAQPEPALAVSAKPKTSEFDFSHPVTDIRQANDWIRNFPQRKFTLKLRGVITYIDLGLSTFYLQQGSNAIPIEGSLKAGLYPLLGQEGTYIEIQGAVKDGYAYCTAPITLLGRGRIPPPLQHSWDYLMTGRDDGLWVQLEGVVTAYERQRLALTVAGGQVVVWINQMDKDIQNRLLGSVVRVSGICSPVVNNRNQRLGLRLLVPSGEYVELVTAPPDDPFTLPAVAIGRVMQVNTDEGSLVGQLVKTRGVVTYRAADMLFLQNGSDGLRVSLRQPYDVTVGDLVEVVGLPQPDGFSPQIAKSLLRKVGRVALPQATPLDLSDVSQDNALSGLDATRSRLEATFLGMTSDDALHVLQFRAGKSGKTFSAFLPRSGGAAPDLEPGSRVRMTGVFKAKVDNAPDFGQVITSYEFYVNSPFDIAVMTRPPWWTLKHTLGLLGCLAAVLLVSLAWAGSLHRKVAERTRQLSDEIDERKRFQAEADKANRDLIVAARHAGMAEVAIGVLHNVGNVLNSVNVSATVVSDKLRTFKITGLGKSLSLIRDNQNRLTEFFNSDDKGKRLLPYLEMLSKHAEEEQREALGELENLSRNIEHIKDIVTVQQNYATFSGMIEPVQVIDLVEDALRMNASSLARHDVHIVREYETTPPQIIADKHKILQILVNLIRNAQQACEESGKPEKKVVVRVANGSGSIKVSTVDNGVGIAPENVSLIFNHGFTTRKDGHGFGLHTSALAAREMGWRPKIL